MPELPEVETIRRQLAPLVQGRTLERVAIGDLRWSRPLAPAELEDVLAGRTVVALRRRGKYLVWELDDEVFLVQHLRMTGTVLYDADPGTPHVHVRIALSDGHELSISDPRRFGTGELVVGEDALTAFFAPRLGVEPLDGALDGPALRAMVRGRRAPIKAVLLDQRRIAGVGNIYADESLFAARIHPLRPANTLGRDQVASLASHLRRILGRAANRGGSTLRDYRDAFGQPGSAVQLHQVYGREAEPCSACRAPLEGIRLQGRATVFCPRCQNLSTAAAR